MKTVLLIGGAGYVGTVITSLLLKKGYKVKVLDNFIYENQDSIQSFLGDENYEFIYGDLSIIEDVRKASQEVNYVVILAGLVGDPITKKFPEASDKINEYGIRNCIDYYDSSDIEKLILISTCSNYGLIKDNELADENFDLNPLSLYAKAKVAAELHLMSKKGKVGYYATVLRFATAFGLSPRMRFDLSVSEFVRDLYFQKELLVFDEDTWRPYCHVRDFARLIEMIFNSEREKVDFQVFNAGGDINNNTKKMIVDSIATFIPNTKVKYANNGADRRNYKVSFKKVKENIGFEPMYSVKNGIQELIEAFKIGVYKDSLINANRYGNYEIKY